jgi:ribosomal protein S18 acetylase RimI-like enzyme
MSKIKVRVLAPKDLEIYKLVRLMSLKDSPDSFGSTYEREVSFSDSEWLARLAPSSEGMIALPLVAEMNGKEVGLASGLIRDSDPKVACIYQMWVSPDARGKGIATLFLKEIEAWAMENECASMELSVTTINNAAVGLYRSYGFTPVGDLEELRAGAALFAQPMAMALRYAA